MLLTLNPEQAASIDRRLGETAWLSLSRRSPRARLFALAGVETLAELAERLEVSKSGLHKVLQMAERQGWLSEEWAKRLASIVEQERQSAMGASDDTPAITALDIFVLFSCERQVSQLVGQLTLPIETPSVGSEQSAA